MKEKYCRDSFLRKTSCQGKNSREKFSVGYFMKQKNIVGNSSLQETSCEEKIV